MKYFLSVLCVFLICHFAASQGYDRDPCTVGNPALKALLQKKVFAEWLINACGPNTNPRAEATSFLKASGKAPMSEKDKNFKRPDDWEGDQEYDRWSCMYAAGAAIDGDPATAWVEGIGGSGKGELLLLTDLNLSGKIEILAGFAKTPALFTANNRPKTINLHVVRATPMGGNLAQCETYRYESIQLKASVTLTLRDVKQFQSLFVPPITKEKYTLDGKEFSYDYWLLLEIIDVYRGSKYDDTCISEIRNVK